MKNETCAILVPVHSAIEPETEAALRELASRGYPVRMLRGSSQIDLARSMLATEAVRDGFAETMWIDADVVFDPDDVDRIRAHGLPLCAGLYAKKNLSGFAGKFRAGTTELRFGKAGGLLEMEYVGMGFTHVRREVYEAIAEGMQEVGGGYEGKTLVPYFLPMVLGDYLSEDYSFCVRARQSPLLCKIMADTSIRLGHVGRKVFTWDDLVAQKQTSPDDSPAKERDDVSSQLYEQLGRKQERIEQLDAAYDFVARALAGVLDGSIDPSRVLVNLTDRTVSVMPEGQSPGLPATINGVPQCVIAKPATTQEGFFDEVGPVVIEGRNLIVRRVETPTA